MDVYLISKMPAGSLDAFSNHVESVGRSFLGPQYDVGIRSVFGSGPLRTVVTVARNLHNPMPELHYQDERLAYVFSGYLADDVTGSGSMRGYIRNRAGDVRPVTSSPGGIYSYATVRRSDGQICAGHSTPTLEPTYYQESRDQLHVGNHPLFVHAAARSFEPPAINEPFFFSSVSAGVAIDNSTPFVGCYRIPPETVLVNESSNCSIALRPAPRPSFGNYRIANTPQRTQSVAAALIEAGSILERLPKAEFRVSGGKDSRLVAAYVKHAGIETIPINQNFPEEVEGQVADMVARELGASECVRQPIEEVIDRDDIEGGTLRKIAYSGGLPAVASLQYPTKSEGSIAGVPLIMGHAHLQRGGFLSRIRSVQDAHEVAESRTLNGYLLPGYVERNRQQVRRFVDGTISKSGNVVQRLSFYAYLEYAMNYQFQSLYAYVRNWNVLVTPLVDERFVALCREIVETPGSRWRRSYAGITDLHGERVAMGVIQRLAPSLLEFPLADARYRADVPDLPGHSLRDPDLIVAREIPNEQLARIVNTRRMGPELRGKLWERIESTVVASFARAATRPEIWAYVSNPRSRMPEGENLTLLNQFMWGLYGLSIILGSDWWTQLSKP